MKPCRQATCSVVPSAAALVIKALKEPPRDRKKVGIANLVSAVIYISSPSFLAGEEAISDDGSSGRGGNSERQRKKNLGENGRKVYPGAKVSSIF